MQSDDFTMKLGSDIIPFNLKNVDDSMISSESFSKDVLVVIFTCNHCPYAVFYEDRLINLANDFKDKVDFVAINSNDSTNYPQDDFENMKIRSKEKNFPFPYLHDKSQEIAKSYGGLVTPHVFVFNKDRKLVFQGGIDDNQNYKEPVSITKTFLKDAIIASLNGIEIETKLYPVLGCSIKWKD